MSNDKLHIDIDLITRYFSGECTPEEQNAVLQWKESSTENNAEFRGLEEVWKAMDTTMPDRNIDIEAEWTQHQNFYLPKEIQTAKNRSLYFSIRIAASILLLLGLGYFGWYYFSDKTVASDIAATQQITLPDGSKVTLNAGSRLNYKTSFGRETRLVSLQGEAYFEVTKNPNKPFIISVNGAEVKVLGTSFNIKAYSNDANVEVTVAEGTVTVYRKGDQTKQVIITKGQQAVYNPARQIIEKKENSDRNFIAWKTRTIVFENDSLSNIVKTLQSVYHLDFIIEGVQLKNCTVTTSFEDKDLGTVLKILKSTLDISFEEKDGKIVIKGKGC